MLYADLVPEVATDVPGCPQITIERALRDSCIEFFDQSLAYTIDQDPEPLVPGLSVVELAIPANTRLVQLLRAQAGRFSLERLTRDTLMSIDREWQAETGMPKAVTFDSETSIRLLPAVDRVYDEKLYLRFAVTPTLGSTSIPDRLAERHYRALCMGAKSLLWLMPGRTWSNPQQGVVYRQTFESAIRDARLAESQDRVSAQKQVRLRRVV